MWLQPSLPVIGFRGRSEDMQCISYHCICIMKRDIYCYMQVVLSMKISIILIFICNLVCLNCCLINYDLNNLLKQFAC
jgi:hypothetical protein